MKKSRILLTALFLAAITTPVFAASNPADNVQNYSYSIGKKAYEARMSENHPWYDNEDEKVSCTYSFNPGSQSAEIRNNTFASMPEGAMEKEDVEVWFQNHNVGIAAGETACIRRNPYLVVCKH